MRADPVVSIIICTRNRADSLRETLESVGRVCVPEDMPAELLVVDNGSTDHTKEVVEQAGLPNIPLRHVLEPESGQCHARNRGIRVSAGDILLWTDDDCRVPEDWIEQMCRPILNGEADAVGGGLRLAPHLFREWMRSPILGVFSITPPSEPHQECGPFLIGGNMAFGRHVLDKVPGFDPALGPGGYGYGEDTLFHWQLSEAGFRVVGRPWVAVEHHFDPQRLTRQALIKDAIRRGQTYAYLHYHWAHDVPRFVALRLLKNWAVLWLLRLWRWKDWHREEGMTMWEYDGIYRISLNRMWMKMSGTPRRYEKRGLSLLNDGHQQV